MKNQLLKTMFFATLIVGILASCSGKTKETSDGDKKANEVAEAGEEKHENGTLELSELKFKSIGIQVDTLSKKALSGIIEANGQLEVPPQYEATVTAIIGANVMDIKVIEGDEVKKGQVLGTISHPDLITLQTNYIKAYSDMVFLEQENERQKRLYEAKVGSGKAYQKSNSEVTSIKGLVKGYESQLRHLNISPAKIRNGNIVEEVAVVSPIKGFVEKVTVNIGQYVNPQDKMFMIVDNDHVHADLMVFEKDVFKLKEGQEIDVQVQSILNKTLKAKIYSIGKQFETAPKAIHVHAEIDYTDENLIPGMYVNGKIHTEETMVYALPEEAVVEENGKKYTFSSEEVVENGKNIWKFTPIEIKTGISHDGWVEVKFLEEYPKSTQFISNQAYYLMAEMSKGETGHSH
ncbi:RND family efflux transporter, MFP subunit [Galbibacter orientalis DSM 19592]|uniref:RND family efflux transporter, MFP subunit n=1 Tax=Galbibacter orientalis DSM 19592 TaxID=926559 RepID=I3C0Y4_9FLAO|nr:efflux RND transporter periplasmic adaptor subunit [Galbibacter orientalis]EIJ37277.1 RND family efflux transporter, MFP subunit [Galbibacter orientalis DSM 19592]